MSTGQADATEAMRAGIAAYDRGDLDEAAAHFERATRVAPDHPAAGTNLGHVWRAAGRFEDAAAAYRRAVEIAPSNAQAWLGLADVLRRLGEVVASCDAYASAIAAGEETAAAYNALGVALKEDGRLDEAERAYRRAIELVAPREDEEGRKGAAAVHVNLGNVLGDQGRWTEAIAEYETALRKDGTSADASFNLFSTVYDIDAAAGERALRHAVAMRPGFSSARFHLGALLALGDDDRAAAPLLEGAAPHWLSSLAFVRDHGVRAGAAPPQPGAIPLFADGLRLLERALAECRVEGSVIELGVRRGASIRFIAKRIGTRIVHGFDSFEGLPSAWGSLAKGAYSTQGELPSVPDNVVLHRGWYKDSLAPFAADNARPIRFLNVDCDLYASTRDAFDALGHLIVEGTIVVFDEYLSNPGWEDEEHRALVEAAERVGFAYRYLAFSLFGKQAAIVVTRTFGRGDALSAPQSRIATP